MKRGVSDWLSPPCSDSPSGLYVQSVDPLSEISVLGVQSSKVDVTKRLLSNEAFKVVIGDDVFRQEWVKQDLDKLLINGKPNKKKWSEIHPVTGADASLVLPWFTFAIHFVYNIPNQPEDKNLVLTPVTIKKILDGKASNWTDSDIAVENPWIASIVPPPGFIKV